MTTAPRTSAERAAYRRRSSAAPRPIKRAAILTAPQLQQLMATATPRDAALIAVMAAGACRVGEATLLQWSDINGATATVPGEITKTGRSRSFTLPPAAMAAVEQWRQQCPSPWLFPGRNPDHPLTVRAAQLRITAMAEEAGITGVSSHSLRRSALTAAHQAGLPLRAVAQISGHESLRSLQDYLDSDAHQQQAEEARSLLFQTPTHD